LTLDLSFGHNLCLKCPNGSYEPILNIYIPKYFQCYRELFNPMGFDPCNRSLKIWESIGTLTPKVGAHLGVWGFIPSQSPTFLRAWDVTPGLPSWFAPLQTLILVASPKLGLWHQLLLFFIVLLGDPHSSLLRSLGACHLHPAWELWSFNFCRTFVIKQTNCIWSHKTVIQKITCHHTF